MEPSNNTDNVLLNNDALFDFRLSVEMEEDRGSEFIMAASDLVSNIFSPVP